MNINEEMIRRGMAREYTYHTPYMYQNDFLSAQREAQETKRGIWSNQPTPSEKKQHSTSSKRVYKNGPNGGCYYMSGKQKKYVSHSYCGR